jgi:hypothetical protein
LFQGAQSPVPKSRIQWNSWREQASMKHRPRPWTD